MKVHKILVPVDGSESSRGALEQAIGLARRFGCGPVEVVAVYAAYEGDLDVLMTEDMDKAMSMVARVALQKAHEVAGSLGARIVEHIEQGDVYERIIDTAEHVHADLIVMGRRGLRRLERALLGSVTARVIGHTDIPVLVIPRGAKVSFDNVLVATDGSDYSEAALVRAMEVGHDYGAKVTVVGVVEENDEALALAPNVIEKYEGKMRKILDEAAARGEKHGVKVTTMIREGVPHAAIAETADKTGAGLLILGSHGRKGLRKFLMGSVTEKVIGHINCPVLVAKIC